MAEETMERVSPARDRSGTAGALARPLTDEERARELPCCVRHPDAGGLCGWPAGRMVYGLLFCEEHGAEATAGALSELYQDAADVLERLDSPNLPHPNQEAANALDAAWRRFFRLGLEHEGEAEEEALKRAYPVIPERVDAETTAYDYHVFDPAGPSGQPTGGFGDARRLLCKLMRIAYEDGSDWLVEILEHEREGASAQLAFALEDCERKVGTPEERERRREALGDRPAE